MPSSSVRKAEYGEPNRVSVEDMLYEIAHQSVTVAAVADQMSAQLQEWDPQVIRDASHVYITGCGDSYFAGIAARLAFQRFGGIHVEPVEALEFGRYLAEFIPPHSIVFAISNSGKATRTVEAAIQGREHGAHTVAITGNPDGWLARETATYLDQSVRLEGRSLTMPSNLDTAGARSSFGLANFLASLTTLYMTAFHFGQVRGVLSREEVARLQEEVREMAERIQETVELCDPYARRYAEAAREIDDLAIMGGGPAYAMALFYAAKTYELARINGASQELEEWAHEQFFITREGTPTLFIAPPGRSYSRAIELLQTANTLGAQTVVVTDEAGGAARELADFVLPVAGRVREEFMALPYCVPGELLATHLAAAQGRDAFEFDSDLQYVMNMKTIQESALFDAKQGR